MRDAATSFQRDGVAVVRGLLSEGEVDLVERAIDRVVADPSELAIVMDEDGAGRFIEDFRAAGRFSEIARIVTSSAIGAWCGEMMDASLVRFHHDHVLVKEPGTRLRTPWHQDLPYYNIEGSQNVSVWIPVDPVSRDAALEFVAGSHTGSWFTPRTFAGDTARWFPEGTFPEVPDIDADRDAYPIVGWGLEPGDAVFFHMLTLHAGGGVEDDRQRRVLSLRFVGDDMVFAPREWKTSPPFPELDRLEAGAPLDHPLFPVIWSRPLDAP